MNFRIRVFQSRKQRVQTRICTYIKYDFGITAQFHPKLSGNHLKSTSFITLPVKFIFNIKMKARMFQFQHLPVYIQLEYTPVHQEPVKRSWGYINLLYGIE